MQSLCNRLAVALSLTALLAYLSNAHAAQYLCVTEKSVGFAYDKVTKTWDNANFTTDAKYLVSESNDPKYAYQLTRIGNKDPLASCKQGFNEYGYIFCADVGFGSGFKLYGFRFNRIIGKFLLTYPDGYYNVVPGMDNPAIDENSITRTYWIFRLKTSSTC
ncbi:MAG TPA: hypothetical protein VKB96_14585 [Gammaproteobacteria bacterium]|nr:hypothetical protein [Gammaproteobacteria bacterium]